MLFKGPLDKQFKNWGKHKQSLPAASAEMKERILQHIKTPVEHVSVVKPHRFVWGTLSGVLVVLLLFISTNLIKQNNRNKQVIYNGCGSGEVCDLLGSSEAGTAAAPMVASSLDVEGGRATGLSAKVAKQDLMVDRAINVLGEASNLVSSFRSTETSVQDIREFLQYNYQASISTRKVEEVGSRLQTIVRGYGGRVDNISMQKKFGYITFVIPKASLEAFKNETKSLVNARFYTENIQAQNLLPEKVNIENSIGASMVEIKKYQEELAVLTKQHNQSVAQLEKSRNAVSANINRLSREVTSSSVRQEQIKKEITGLNSAKAAWQKQINAEHEQHAANKTYLEEYIAMAKSQLEFSRQQDQVLQETVETVQGSIQLQWVSIFEIINIYVPYFWLWIIIIFVLAILIRHYTKRRSFEVI